ncbi:MAG: MBL fold metallo-hydrolase [Candidatus Heimdallarchaeota archaeon]
MKIVAVSGMGFSSNSFILVDEEKKNLLVVDIGFKGLVSGFKLRKALNKIVKKEAKEWQLEVFLSHCHIDHITGEDNLKNFQDILFSASKATAKHINSRDNVTLLSKYGAKIGFQVDKVYNDNEVIEIGNAKLTVIYAPGHTDGSTVLYDITSKSMFSGDVVFDGACGRVDLQTGSHQEMVKSLTNLTEYDVQNLYSGHGPDMHGNANKNILAVKNMMESW